MRSSMVLITSGKPRLKSAASCLAASTSSAAKSSSAASRLPVWFQSSCCSLRTRALLSSTDTCSLLSDVGVLGGVVLCDAPNDATGRALAHPDPRHTAPCDREAREEAGADRVQVR